MKKTALFVGLLMITSCYAWKIINTEEYIKEAQAQLTEESLKLQEKLDARLPVSSKASYGAIKQGKITQVTFSDPLFIIGDDPRSRVWLKTHAKKLEDIHALGFVANISSSEQLQSLQALTNAPLLPANVDDLMSLFQESHYPLAFYEGALWQ